MARAPKVQDVEVMPEADRLEPYPHPRLTERVHGHTVAQQAFAQAIDSGQCHHAWLICGAEGIGKATLGYAVARYAMANADERGESGDLSVRRESRAARQIAALSHPNLLLIRRPYDTKEKRFRSVITVDEVRRLKTFLSHKSGEAAWRVVIVDPIDDLNTAASNALLKSLEEPPPRTLFLLICARPGRLLPTIRSRCRTIQLAPLGDDDLKAAALEAMRSAGQENGAVDERAWPELVGAAGGSVRRCLLLADTTGLELIRQVRGIMGSLPKVDWPAVHKLADRLAPAAKSVEFEMFFSLMLRDISDAARAAVGLSAPRHVDQLGQRLHSTGRVASWAELWESIAAERDAAVALNLDRRSLVLETIGRLAEAAR